ncbi:amidoligase family protein [Paractinoplanes brasiliensis]|uniref:Putative amidoligase enzyme n=1 Tax=Paractinoplanes brasiliensis TaxID=52695 RepID=A0A4R6JAV2_9ACTN|nr:amidoligase family protein [Actinoplanes brasiliensis]TDO31605.1 putative amidoligase enzyme [Actinoplanes brasiliensis]
MTTRLRRRVGFEIELMAPPGVSRRSLADDLAARSGGRSRPVWHRDSEPSLVPGLGRFLNLTLGYAVDRPDGSPLCTLVDDITLIDGLDPRTPAPPGWFRVLSDDSRLLGLLAERCDPAAPLETVLDPAAALWGVKPEQIGDVFRLDDTAGSTIALAAPAGGERERPCEVITPPLAANHHEALEELLAPARELGFTVPAEAAVHLHLDGGPFRRPQALANVVRLFAHWREPLRALLQTNPACRRLAPLPEPLVAATAGRPGWDELSRAATEGGLTKFFDVNLTQLFAEHPVRDTIEVRILPGSIDAGEIVNRAALAELLLERCLTASSLPPVAADPIEQLMNFAAEAMARR